MRVFGELHRHRDDLVLLQNLDDAFRASGAVGDEHHRVAALPRLTDVDDPVVRRAREIPSPAWQRNVARLRRRHRAASVERRLLGAAERLRTLLGTNPLADDEREASGGDAGLPPA